MAGCTTKECSVKVFDIIASLYVVTFRYTYDQITNGREDGGGLIDDVVVGALFTDNYDLEQIVTDICLIYRIERSFTANGLRIYRNAGIEEPNTIAAEIDASELAVTDTATDGAASNLPTKVAFNFLDADNDYKPNQLTAKRPDAVQTDQERQISLPFVMHLNDAEKLVNRLLSWGRLANITHSFRLPPRFAWLGKGDVVKINHGTFADLIRITQTDFNADKSQSVSGVTVGSTNRLIPTVPHSSEVTRIGGPVVDSDGLIFDIPLINITDEQDVANNIELYYGVVPVSVGNWQGGYLARLFSNDGVQYTTVLHSYGQSGKAGSINQRWTTANKLANKRWVTDTDRLNLSNPNDVWPTSFNTDKAYIDTHSYTNLALYGAPGRWELIQFEAVVDGIMSGIVRGLRGTEGACGLHEVGDKVIVVAPGFGIAHIPMSRIGQPHKYRAVSVGDDFLSAIDIEPPNIAGNSRKPFAPYHFKAKRETNNDITITWLRRDRKGTGWGETLPMSEGTLAFTVKIATPDGAVLRTLAATAATVVYTSAMQSTDAAGGMTDFLLNINQVGLITPVGFVGSELVHV